MAGITIATITGNNGLLNRAKEAREETHKQTATEKINLKITNIQISSWAEKQEMPTLQYLADGFCDDEEMEYVELASKKQASILPQIKVGTNESIFVKLKEYPYEFEINKSLQLASIDGVKITDVADNSQDLTTMQETIEQLQKEITELKSIIENQDSKILNLENTITTLNGQYNDLVTTVSNINPTLGELTYTMLGSLKSTTETTVTLNSPLSKYRYVVVVLQTGSGIRYYSGLTPVETFYTNPIAVTSVNNYVKCVYETDTKCKLLCSNSAGTDTCYLYGVD